MANVLCIYENKIATVASTENFLVDLTGYDDQIAVKFAPVMRLSKDELSWCDILLMIRPNNSIFARIAKCAKKNGILIVFFLDDDLLHLPEGNADMPWRKAGIACSAREADIILSSSPYICKNYSKDFGVARVVSIDTAVPDGDIREHIDGVNERIKIVYAAGLAHKVLFDEFIAPVLEAIDHEIGDKISLTFMGVHPDVDVNKYRMPIQFIDALPLNEYRTRIAKENFDIGLAPLVTSEFTKCKYFNKFIEYSMFGIVGLYSDTEPYTFVINNKENGFLVKDDPNEWMQTICSVVKDDKSIRECRTEAYRLLRERFNTKIIMDSFIGDIPEMTSLHVERKFNGYKLKLFILLYAISRFGDWIYKFFFYLKKGGVKEILKGVRRHINTSRIVKT